MLETAEIRGHLEALAVRKAVARLDPLGEARLEACLEEEGPSRGLDTLGELFPERLGLHRVIAELAASPVLAETLEVFFRRTAVYALLLPLPEEELIASAREHREIVATMIRRDADGAEALIRAHASLQGKGDAAMLRERRWQKGASSRTARGEGDRP
ncbi:MAG: transcriptional regulator NanR [Synergistetes bacterium ADurb.Bin520]|nr:MAG: transcriptional regulator NanR [Synergistetes bacterium ADurb.Bin520]